MSPRQQTTCKESTKAATAHAPKKIYVIRHGQTDFNLRGIVQGRGVDASLNEKGRLQAEAFYRAYQHIPFDAVHTSTLKRSMESVRHFIDAGTPHYAWEGLNEIHWGNREGKPIAVQENRQYLRLIRQWRAGHTRMRFKGGESPAQVARRQDAPLRALLKKDRTQHILVCMHGRAMRILLCRLFHHPICRMDVFPHENMCLYQVIYTGTMCRIETFNDTRHLRVTAQQNTMTHKRLS